jgi:magnesium transporter
MFASVWRRAPWLAAAWLGGIFASFVIHRFEGAMAPGRLPLRAFIPVIIGMAGNVGTQSLTIVVRGLATRRIDVKHFWRVLGVQTVVGLFLGLIYGAALGAMGFVQLRMSMPENSLMMAGLVGGTSAGTMMLAAAIGTVMPLFFAKLHIDPAVATGPFVTTLVDVLGVSFYLTVVTMAAGV